MNVLVIAAHPDDELLGAGGTVALHAEKGDNVCLAILCEGVSNRYEPEWRKQVIEQSRQAGAILGASEIVTMELPDQRLDTFAISVVAGYVEELVTKHKPEVVYTHFGGDVNADHRVLCEAVVIATRPYSAPFVREVLQFETPSSTEWGTPSLMVPFHPSVFVDISGTLAKKVEAFGCYTAEVRSYPHPRSLEAVRDRARYWGSLSNCGAAEPFVPIRIRR